MGLLSDGPTTFLILSLGPKCQQDYSSARSLTKKVLTKLISQRPHFSISSLLDSRCTPQFCYLRNSSALLILVVLWSSQRFVGTHQHNYTF